MEKLVNKKYHYIFIALYFILNLINSYLVTSNLIENLLPYKYSFIMVVTSLIGNVSVLSIVLGFGLLIFKNEKHLNIYLLIFTLIFGILYFAMSVYSNYYGMMFDFSNLGAVGNDTISENNIFFWQALPHLLKVSVPFFFLVPLLLLIIHIVFQCKKNKIDNYDNFINKRLKKGLILVILCFILVFVVNGTVSLKNKNTYYESNVDPLYSVQNKGFMNHYVGEAVKYLFNIKKDFKEDEKNEVLKKLDNYINNNDYSNEYTNIFENKNLLLIQMESINNFLIGLELEIDGQYYEVTPNLNKLVKENIYFDNYYTNVGIANTSDAELSVMTGLYPLGHASATFEYCDNEYQTLPKMFKEKGYSCYSFHANTGNYYDRITVHPNTYGFDKFYGSEELNVNENNVVNHWIGDEDFYKQVIDVMKEEEKNTFAFAISISNHTPFSIPINGTEDKWFKSKNNFLPKDYKLVSDSFYDNIYRGFIEYVNYSDYAIGEAIKYLKETGLYEDTVVILYGDHGIDCPVYDLFYEASHLMKNDINPLITNGNKNQKLLEMQIMNEVPLIIASPDISNKTISTTRNHTCLSSTISNLFGLNQKYSFSPDCFSNEKMFAFSVKNSVIYMDDLIIDSRSRKHINNSGKNVNVEEVIKNYQAFRDLNNKIYYYDLLS